MISVNDFKTGITIELDGELYTVVDFQHVKPGKGSAFVRSKLRKLKTGYTIDKTFRAGEKVTRAHIERRAMQFLYSSGEDYFFMDNQSYEQINLPKDLIGSAAVWLKDGTNVQILFHGDTAIGVEIPNFVEFKVTYTEPGFKGDTATAGTKPATLETGVVVQVPLFIEVGNLIQVDTRTNSYLKRL